MSSGSPQSVLAADMVDGTTTISGLPVELCDHIVARLDIQDVLSLSLTCKYFRCAIMESRQTWIRFVQKAQLQPNISKIEEPVEDFTIQELRDWVLRRHKLRQSLHSSSRAASHYIRGTDSVRESVLLPGGRWLLFEDSPAGNISYTDCDAPRPQTQSLINFEDVVPDHINTKFVVWRDPHSPRLTFRVAILYWYNREDGDQCYQTHFCKIDLVGHGSSAKLVAERLHLYQGGIPYNETSGQGIRGEYFYQVHYIRVHTGISSKLSNRQATLEILDYRSGSLVAKQVKLVDFHWCMFMWRFDILPDGRIAVSGASEIVIYPDPLPIIGDEMKTLAPSLVIETIRYPMIGGPVSMSEWYLGLDSNMVVCGGSHKSLIAVWIPHDGAPPMNRTTEKRMSGHIGRPVLGLFHGVAMSSLGCIDIFNYPWGGFQSDTDSGGMTRRVLHIQRGQDIDTYAVDWEDLEGVDLLYFNEEFGRAIMRNQHRGYFVVDIIAT